MQIDFQHHHHCLYLTGSCLFDLLFGCNGRVWLKIILLKEETDTKIKWHYTFHMVILSQTCKIIIIF